MTKLSSSSSAVSSTEISSEHLHEIVRGLTDDPNISPEEVLKNPDILILAIAFARKQRSLGRLERKKTTALNVVAARLRILLDEGFDEYNEENKRLIRTRGVLNLQDNEPELYKLSPQFVFEDINLATSWRWLLVGIIRHINCLFDEAKKRGEPRRNLLSDFYEQLQKHINAVDLVLKHIYDVDAKHSGKDLREEVKKRIFLESDEYAEFVFLLKQNKKLCELFDGLMSEECQTVQ